MSNNNDTKHRNITMTPIDAFKYARFYEERGFDVNYTEIGVVNPIDGTVKHSFTIKPCEFNHAHDSFQPLLEAA